MTNDKINGQTSLMKSSNFTSTMEHTVNIIDPNGGVNPPIIILTIKITPKCKGSTPKAFTAGTNNGAKITKAAPPSINIPTNNNKTLITINNTTGLLVKFINPSVII